MNMMAEPMMVDESATASSADAGTTYSGGEDDEDADSMRAEADAPPPNFATQGDLGVAHLIKLKDALSVNGLPSPDGLGPGNSRRVFATQATVPDSNVTIFAYSVPSQRAEGFLSARISYAPMPFLANSEAHIYIDESYMGRANINTGVVPGQPLNLDLGSDVNFQVKVQNVLSQKSTQDDAKWFDLEKKEKRAALEERLITAKSSHSKPILAVVVEPIPTSTDSRVEVQLLSPDPAKISSIPESSTDTGKDKDKGRGCADYLDRVVEAARSAPSLSKAVYRCEASNLLYFTTWMQPGESWPISVKYRVVRPINVEVNIY